MKNYTLDIDLIINSHKLNGIFFKSIKSKGTVIFAHGSGSSRLSSRNQLVAKYLQANGISSLLFDLLTKEEEKIDEVTAEKRFDIDLLAKRLHEVAKWVQNYHDCKNLPIGYFGASTGAAAALTAASWNANIKAVVSRGGRPDLAMPYLEKVKAPTLLIVGSRDEEVLELNKKAFDKLSCKKKLEIIPNATHLFEEEGALDLVAEHAKNWFLIYF